MEFKYDPQTEKLIVQTATRTEYHQLDLWLTRNPKGYRFTPAFKAGYWDGKDSVFNNGRINQGLWKECLKACQVINAKFSITNKEEFPINRNVTLESVQNFCKDFFKNHKAKKDGEWVSFMPYDHQIETAYKILKNRYCLAEVATSGGKSLIISIVFFYTLTHINPDAKMLLIVPSISLVTQFFDDMIDYNIGHNAKIDGENPNKLQLNIEEIMSDRPRKHSNTDNPNVCIGTYQSLVNYPNEFFEQFHTVSVDECLHPDTKIRMANNELKNISDIQVGEYVKTINETTKVIEDKKVEYVYKNLSKNEQMYEIEFEDGKIIKITGNHKFLCSDFIWKKVEDLTENDDIIDLNFNI
jgi:hypothetical protein